MNGLRQASSPMILIPAYGRVYATEAEMLKDWQGGKDFRILPFGPYCSVRDLFELKMGSSSITLWDGNTDVTISL